MITTKRIFKHDKNSELKLVLFKIIQGSSTTSRPDSAVASPKPEKENQAPSGKSSAVLLTAAPVYRSSSCRSCSIPGPAAAATVLPIDIRIP
jgi:hypothetical protein